LSNKHSVKVAVADAEGLQISKYLEQWSIENKTPIEIVDTCTEDVLFVISSDLGTFDRQPIRPVVWATDRQELPQGVYDDALQFPPSQFDMNRVFSKYLRTHERLQKRVSEISTLAEHSGFGVVVFNRDGEVLDVNSATVNIFGEDAEELKGVKFEKYLQESIREYANEIWNDRVKGLYAGPRDWAVTLKDDSIKKIRTYTIRLIEGDQMVLVSLLEDFDQLMNNPNRFDKALILLEQVVKSSPIIHTIYDIDQKVNLYQSNSIFQTLGYTPQQLNSILNNSEDYRSILFHKDYIDEVDNYYKEVRNLKDGEKKQLIYRVRDSKGNWQWIRKITSVFKRDGNGNASQVINSFENITELKTTESRIFESEARNKALIQAIPDFIYRLDKNAVCLEFECPDDPKYDLIDGSSKKEYIGKSLTPFFGEDFLQTIKDAILTKEVQKIKYSLNLRGGKFIFEGLVNRINDEEVLLIGRDISEREKSEQLLLGRLKFIEFINQISSDLIKIDSDLIDDAISSALEEVAEFTGSDRGYIFLLDRNRDVYSIEYEAELNGVANYRDSYAEFPMSALYSLEDLLKSNRAFMREVDQNQLDKLPKVIRPVMEDLGIQTFINLPLRVGNELIGLIGFDKVHQSGLWSDELVDYFLITASILSSTIHRKKTISELIQSREKAIEAAKAKEEFLATMSHEIRTPLNAIVGMNHLLREKVSDDESMEMIQAIQSSSDSLLRLINDILDFTKIDSGKVEMEGVDFEVRSYLEKILSTHEVKAQEKGLKLKLECPEEAVMLHGDAYKLEQILNNLLSNAIKFTHEGNVSICAQIESSKPHHPIEMRFDVMDTGIGISDEKREKIFERFVQEDSSTSRNYGGTGLGLAIVRLLVDLMGGELKVKSIKGQVSTFSVILPFEYPKTKTQKVQVNKNSGASLEDKRVLVVEDNKINQLVARKFLENFGMHVTIAENGIEGLECVKKELFDLILMDLHMPGMDGKEATREIKKLDPPLNSIPIIALTADANAMVREEVMDLGMHAYITKPFQPENLKKILLNALGVEV
jgi:PAS domain S-box-containing protein